MSAWGPDAPATPRLARSLRRLAHDVDERWPDRHRGSDGWIGDVAHQARRSDHNPDPRGIVHALDITARGIDPLVLVVAAVLHPSTSYVIYDELIFSASHGFSGRVYDGPDPHRSHVHISILHTAGAETAGRHWLAG